MTKTKFKVGDKVRILPSAVDIGVNIEEIGKTGMVTDNKFLMKYLLVRMEKPRKGRGMVDTWAVHPNDIELVKVLGQQLLLWDDIFEER